MVFGLNVWQGLLVVVVGNLFWAAIGLLAVSGPVSGTPSSVITRSMFGIRGNRVYTGVFNWPTFIAFEAINLCLGALAGFAFADQLGVSPNRPVQILVVVVTAAVTLVISVYGHATILRMSGLFTGSSRWRCSCSAGSCWPRPTGATPPTRASPPAAACSVATMVAGVTIIASSPLSWGISADYARYLPADTSRFAVACWTALGGFIPAVALGSIGVLAGSVVDMDGPADEPRRDPARLVLPGVPADDRVRLHHQQHPDDVQLGPVPAGDRHRAASVR